MNKKILQWNINSIKTKFSELEYLIGEHNVEIVALQETKIPTSKIYRIRGYNIYQKNRDVHGGGVLLAVHTNIPSMQLNINTDLEVVACTILFKDYKLNVCNLYLPDHADVDIDSLNNLAISK